MQFGAITFLCEFVGYHLADLLSIPTPSAAIVKLSHEFVNSIGDQFVQSDCRKSVGPNFATEYKSPGFMTWAVGQTIPRDLLPVAAEIFAFDAILQNPDRRVDNPNILWDGNEFIAFDHEMAFSFLHDVAARKDPAGVLDTGLGFLNDHVFFSALKGNDCDFSRIEGALRSISAEDLRSLEAQVPGPWKSKHLEAILHYIMTVTQAPERALNVVRRLLI